MKNQPLISILTPFKNTERYLDACLQSILNQSYTNWELLIVNDNSTDASNSLVESYADKDKRIKLFQNSGNGIIDALRLAFSESKGEYITRMDSDDEMQPNKLETLLNTLTQKGKQHVAVGLVNYFGEHQISEGYETYENWLNNLTQSESNFEEIYKECVIPSPCWMIHRDDLIACNAFDPSVYPEDYDLTFRFYKTGFKIAGCKYVLHKWRDHEKRTSKTHENYELLAFTKLKIKHFLEIDYNAEKQLVVFGAGEKGKIIAQELVFKNIPFVWISENPDKLEKKIYLQNLHNFEHFKTLSNTQSIITVANPKAQTQFRNYFNSKNQKELTDYFFFC